MLKLTTEQYSDLQDDFIDYIKRNNDMVFFSSLRFHEQPYRDDHETNGVKVVGEPIFKINGFNGFSHIDIIFEKENLINWLSFGPNKAINMMIYNTLKDFDGDSYFYDVIQPSIHDYVYDDDLDEGTVYGLVMDEERFYQDICYKLEGDLYE